MQFVFRAVDEVGATLNAALVVMGDKLGWYRALAGTGGLSPAELAERTGTAERYVREWLNAQAAGGFVDYDPDSGLYRLPPEQTVALTDSEQPGLPAGALPDRDRLGDRLAADCRGSAERRGIGLARARPRRPRGVRALLPARATTPTSWPSGCRRSTASSRSSSGARTSADVGCGHGASTILMAQAFPNSTFVGSDYHDGSIETARAARRGGGRGRSRSTSRPSRPRRYSGTGYDLVTMFDCLHDMGDPVGAARHVRSTLKPDGTWMIVEPQRRGPGRGQPQPGRPCLLRVLDPAVHAGIALAGRRARARGAGGRGADPRCREAGGFTRFRRVAETPFNLVFEARP